MAADGHIDHVLEATGTRARIARVYAEALFALAVKEGQADAVGDDLAALVRDALTGHPLVEAFLASGAVGKKAKQPALDAALKDGVSDLVRNFLGVLNQNGRLGMVRHIQAAYERLRDEAGGRARVRVTSAAPLSDAQAAALKQTLKDSLRADPVLDIRTDPDLLGGLVVQVGDRVYDTSVRARLQNLRTHLMAKGTHVQNQR